MQSLALDVFHHEIENAVSRLAKIGYADRVWMLDRSGCLSFAFETGDGLALLHVVAVEDVLADGLDREFFGGKLFVFCKIHLPHRPAPKTAFEEVTIVNRLRPRQRKPRRRLVHGTHRYFVFVTNLAFGAFFHCSKIFSTLRRKGAKPQRHNEINC